MGFKGASRGLTRFQRHFIRSDEVTGEFQRASGAFQRHIRRSQEVSGEYLGILEVYQIDLGGFQRVFLSSVSRAFLEVPGGFTGCLVDSIGSQWHFRDLQGSFMGSQGIPESLCGVLGDLRSTSRSQGVSRGLQGVSGVPGGLSGILRGSGVTQRVSGVFQGV